MFAELEIEELVEVTDEYEQALARLVPQLSSAKPPSRQELEQIAKNQSSRLFLARVDGEILGMTTLAVFLIPTGCRAIIEDVVVDEAARGRGVGAALVKHAISKARDAGARSVDLTSRPTRVEANRLYQRLGFIQRETNVYRFDLANEQLLAETPTREESPQP